MTKRQLIKKLMSFFGKCLRTIRAYNFDNRLVQECERYYQYIYVSSYVVDKQVLNIRYFFTTAYEKIRLKARLDSNLASNASFQANLAEFERVHKALETRAVEITARLRHERFL